MRRAPASGKNRSSAYVLRGLPDAGAVPELFRTHDAADPESVDADTLIIINAYRLRRRAGADLQPFRIQWNPGICNAHGICNVTNEAEGTLYSVTEFKETNPRFSWSTKTNDVLATHKDKSNQHVMESSYRSLRLKKCLEFVSFEIDVVSEDNTLETLEVNCTTECPEPRNIEGTRNHWVIPFVLLGLLVGSVLCLMCLRNCACSMNGQESDVP